MKLTKKEIEEIYFNGRGQWSIVKSEGRRAALKKDRRDRMNAQQRIQWDRLYEKAVGLAERLVEKKAGK